MLFFGVCFFLYFIKLSAGNGFFFYKKLLTIYVLAMMLAVLCIQTF